MDRRTEMQLVNVEWAKKQSRLVLIVSVTRLIRLTIPALFQPRSMWLLSPANQVEQ